MDLGLMVHLLNTGEVVMVPDREGDITIYHIVHHLGHLFSRDKMCPL